MVELSAFASFFFRHLHVEFLVYFLLLMILITTVSLYLTWHNRSSFMSAVRVASLELKLLDMVQRDAQKKMAQQETKFEDELLHVQLEKLKLQMQFWPASSSSGRSGLTKVQRRGKMKKISPDLITVTHGGTSIGQSHDAAGLTESNDDEAERHTLPEIACAAVYTQDGHSFTSKMLQNSLGSSSCSDGLSELALAPGSHAFVKLPGEEYIRVGLATVGFGEAFGHRQLANQQPVLFAGEIEFSEKQTLLRWNNCSGTYKCPDGIVFQAGLPLEKYYTVISLPETEEARSKALFFPKLNTWMQKALSHEDADFIAKQKEWEDLHQEFLLKRPGAEECYTSLSSMISERRHAIENYGFGFEIA